LRLTRNGLGLAAASLALLTIGSLGGAAQASTSFACTPSGRAICIAITDEDNVTHSTATVNRYTTYTVDVSNGGGSTLANGFLTAKLKDIVAGNAVTTTAKFVAAPTGCTSMSPTTFTCSLPNLGAHAAALKIGPFFAATSTNVAATAIRLELTATFKEKASDHRAPDSQSHTLTWHEDTSLERDPDFSQSVVFFGGSTVLETVAGQHGQSSVFRVPVGSGFGGFGLATLEEFSSGESGYFCPAGFSCFGQSVATSAPGIFSAANLANLVTTIDLALLPHGVTEKSLRVHHDTASFTTTCPGALFSPPSASHVPCRRVVIDREAGLVTIDAWDNHQGDWGFS
jgi:hypothetical protein